MNITFAKENHKSELIGGDILDDDVENKRKKLGGRC